MIKREGKDGLREWTEYGFRHKGKNHLVVIQRTYPPQLYWNTFHLEGRAQDDPIHMVEGAPLSRTRAEAFVRGYIRNLVKA